MEYSHFLDFFVLFKRMLYIVRLLIMVQSFCHMKTQRRNKALLETKKLKNKVWNIYRFHLFGYI